MGWPPAPGRVQPPPVTVGTALIALIGGRDTAPNGLYLPPQAEVNGLMIADVCTRIKQLEEKFERLDARSCLCLAHSYATTSSFGMFILRRNNFT